MPVPLLRFRSGYLWISDICKQACTHKDYNIAKLFINTTFPRSTTFFEETNYENAILLTLVHFLVLAFLCSWQNSASLPENNTIVLVLPGYSPKIYLTVGSSTTDTETNPWVVSERIFNYLACIQYFRCGASSSSTTHSRNRP